MLTEAEEAVENAVSGGDSIDAATERFIHENGVDGSAAQALRDACIDTKARVISRGQVWGARNPSSVVHARIRDAGSTESCQEANPWKQYEKGMPSRHLDGVRTRPVLQGASDPAPGPVGGLALDVAARPPTRLYGTLRRWKGGNMGGYGWIEPEHPVRHPLACLHRGSIFLSGADAVAVPNLCIGQRVSFSLYEDCNGLGADGLQIEDP
jgi:hypothetical protein